jgi:FKBP-type peptidyl-prolyl cis-trans isomerase
MLTVGAIVLIMALYVGIRLSQEPRLPDEPEETADTSQSTAATDKGAPAGTGKLEKKDLKVGTGAEAKPGQMVTVHYRGTLTNGTKFDASYDRGEPFTFTLGQGQVIKGWDEGVAGMKVGGRRRLVIPPDLGYGPNGSPPKIPGNATLVFEIELLKVG